MPLPAPNLDDLRFQKDLVDEARRRIVRYCPEWTDYNVSDPGITLIELFAWMTEMIVYRLNRVPEKNYIKFLDLLGVNLLPASSARADLTFWLSAPFPLNPEDDTVALVPQGTEVATRRSDQEDEVIFTTDRRLLIAPPKLVQLRRQDDFNKNYLPRLGIEPFFAFDRYRPQEGDAFYLGFAADETDLAGHLLSLFFTCQKKEGTGIRRDDPPLVWECSVGGGQWQEIRPSSRPGEKDSTGGLNNATGQLVLYLPLTLLPDQVHGHTAFWVRCRYEQRRREQGRYTETPRIHAIEGFVLGATTPATHARYAYNELLGTGNGEPSQTFYLRHNPVLPLDTEEAVQVEERQGSEVVFASWTATGDFSRADRFDRHFHLDAASGAISFGPSIRQPDGSVRQYGRVPEAGRQIRVNQYRYGGGAVGNVPEGKIRVLKEALAYIDQVANLQRAEGGRDQETLDEAMMRMRRDLRAQERAVTANDYENLAKGASRAVARVRCLAPGELGDGGNGRPTLPPGMVELLLVPAVPEALVAGDLSKLHLTDQLQSQVLDHLDKYRLLTTTLRVRPPRYLGVQVRAKVVGADYVAGDVVSERVIRRIDQFLSPLALAGDLAGDDEIFGPHWEGWAFGRNLYISELYSLIQKVDGVKHVLDVELSIREVLPKDETPPPVDSEPTPAEQRTPDRRLRRVQERLVTVAQDMLICSLAHEVELVEV